MPLENKEQNIIAELEDGRSTRGKLTVFLGAAAGVGKTYTMLESAKALQQAGEDVVVGWVSTYRRPETEKLLEELRQMPPKVILYQGRTYYEPDIDGVLARRPQTVLIDELAHTNAPTSRHVRRFQDIEEVLNAGINVYTTLNIQHLESLNDIVAQITGVVVQDTVPDSIVEQADQVQLIDIPPAELVKRLKEGKIYIPLPADQALHKFFRLGNINALRELALRFTANRVDKDLHEYMQEHDIPGPWPVGERVMVCVSSSPFSAQLIRAARTLARGLQAELLAVHIEIPHPLGLSEQERDRIFRNMRLAEEMGAKTLSLVGNDLTEEILAAAREYNVNHLVVGKPLQGRIREWLSGRAVVDKLIRNSGGLNIHVIQGRKTADKTEPRIKTEMQPPSTPLRHYIAGLLMLGLITVFNWWWREYLDPMQMIMIYLLPVLLSAVWWGKGPSYLTALFSVLLFDYFFTMPVYSLDISDYRYMFSLPLFLLVAFIIGRQAEKLRTEVRLARQREKATRVLYAFSRDIAAVTDAGIIVRNLTEQARQTLERPVAVFLPDASGRLQLHSEDGSGQEVIDSWEMAVAVWAYEHNEVAGCCTETLPEARYMHVPLTSNGNAVGVFAIHIQDKMLTPGQQRLVEAWAGLAAMAVERVNLAEQARQTAALVLSDKLRTALFNSISHELRTPLASIIGAISSLLDTEGVYSEDDRKELLKTVQDGADRMDRLVANLLDTARLESGMMQLKKDWCDVEDVIGIALRRVEHALGERPLIIDIEPELPLLMADCVLLEQILINLLDNACKYSPAGSEITIEARQEEQVVAISVADRGVGIPYENLNQVFDKFYRVEQPKSVSGTGLGLSICKGIAEAHGGAVVAQNRSGGGTVMTFTVPVSEQPALDML